MAEIDIDKILEKSEKEEKQKKSFRTIQLVIVIVAALCVAGAMVASLVMVVTGETGAVYMPLKAGSKYLYNKVGGSIEKRQLLEKPVNIDGVDCRVINIIDQGNYTSYQLYLYESTQGLVQLATSQNFGEKEKNPLLILPLKIKANKKFIAGVVSGKQVNGLVAAKEKVLAPSGMIDSYRIELKADKYFDRTIWFGKETGMVKMIDKVKKEEINLLSIEQ